MSFVEQFVLLLCSNIGLQKYTETKVLTTYFYLAQSIFDKCVQDYFLQHILCIIFLGQYFSCYILLTDQISRLEILGNMCIVIKFVSKRMTIQAYYQSIFLYDQKSRGGEKGPATCFSSVTSTNVAISLRNFLTFSFNPFVTLV